MRLPKALLDGASEDGSDCQATTADSHSQGSSLSGLGPRFFALLLKALEDFPDPRQISIDSISELALKLDYNRCIIVAKGLACCLILCELLL